MEKEDSRLGRKKRISRLDDLLNFIGRQAEEIEEEAADLKRKLDRANRELAEIEVKKEMAITNEDN